MKKVLLTSAGFDNKKVADKFLELVNKPVEEIKVLFITTAAVEVDAIMVLPACIEDLTKVCGIKVDNITVYDMHKLISEDEINKYDFLKKKDEIKLNWIIKKDWMIGKMN